MGRKSLKSVRQKEIIEAFYNVSKIESLENTSIAKVAKAMDVNTSLILHYFDSKEDMIFGLINYILERYKSIYVIEENGNVEIKLRNTIDNLFSKDWNNLVDDGVFYSSYALIFQDDKIKKAFKELHDSLRFYLAEVLKEANDQNVINIENPKKTAELIFVLVEGTYYYLSLFNSTDKEYHENLTTYKDMALKLLNFKTELATL